jgi:EAL domain-containing protein (putative c-di-GMP-specific phosphodiesterase class I)
MPPGAFLSNAERFDLMGAIDRWVLRQAIELLDVHGRAGNDISLSVNLSGKTMNDDALPAELAGMLAMRPIEPDRLVIEVTETAAIVNIDRARELANDLRGLGCGFALDDFGSGFASFYYLKHLDFDFLKIDGEFIRKLSSTPTDQLVVRAVVDIARGLDTKTVAEFVGDADTVELLRSLGIDYGQGYHLGRPGPVNRVLPPLPDIAGVA